MTLQQAFGVRPPGGRRFSDYPRLGAPLGFLVLIVGSALIAMVWPLRGQAGRSHSREHGPAADRQAFDPPRARLRR